MDGILNIYKEAGYTSHDVVAKLRGILHQKKIGHTGTLDPEATGVLPVCIGKATKVCELLADRDKTYQAVCRLGIVTDTQDMTGTVLEESSFKEVSEERLRETVLSFLGESFQIPPMYSALKVDGKKLYELAREGKTVKREPRRIFISSIEILQIDLEDGIFMFEVSCSKGTYIRTLCHDIGQRLGVGAVMESLVRIRVGEFLVENAFTLEKIENFANENPEELEKNLYTIDMLFKNYPKFQIKDEFNEKLYNGNILGENSMMPYPSSEEDEVSGTENFQKILLYDSAGMFKAIYEQTGHQYKVVKMF